MENMTLAEIQTRLRDIEMELGDAVEGISTAETLLRETGSNVPNTTLWNQFRRPVYQARHCVRSLILQLEAREEKEASA